MKNYKIAVAGTGYVGLSLSVLLAQHNQVMAVDIVQAKVDMIDNMCTFCAKALFLELCVYYKTLAGKLHPRTC